MLNEIRKWGLTTVVAWNIQFRNEKKNTLQFAICKCRHECNTNQTFILGFFLSQFLFFFFIWFIIFGAWAHFAAQFTIYSRSNRKANVNCRALNPMRPTIVWSVNYCCYYCCCHSHSYFEPNQNSWTRTKTKLCGFSSNGLHLGFTHIIVIVNVIILWGCKLRQLTFGIGV